MAWGSGFESNEPSVFPFAIQLTSRIAPICQLRLSLYAFTSPIKHDGSPASNRSDSVRGDRTDCPPLAHRFAREREVAARSAEDRRPAGRMERLGTTLEAEVDIHASPQQGRHSRASTLQSRRVSSDSGVVVVRSSPGGAGRA